MQQASNKNDSQENRFNLISAKELVNQELEIDWLLKNIIEKESINLLFGKPASGKSLFALDWAFCIASGIEWCGLKTKKSGVFIIAGEGYSGLNRRLKALELKYKTTVPESLFISKMPAQFNSVKSTEEVANAINESGISPGLIIIDTLHRNMEGDENSSKDIGVFVRNIDCFLKPLGAAVLIVHHSGHNDDKRSRGSSSIRGAMDAEFSSSDTKGLIKLECHKAKDFEPLKPMTFSLNTVEVGYVDEEENQITSVYLQQNNVSKNNSVNLNKKELEMIDCLKELTLTMGERANEEIRQKFPFYNPEENKYIKLSIYKEKCFDIISVESNDNKKAIEAKRKAFERGYKKLINSGYCNEMDGYIWLTK